MASLLSALTGPPVATQGAAGSLLGRGASFGIAARLLAVMREADDDEELPDESHRTARFAQQIEAEFLPELRSTGPLEVLSLIRACADQQAPLRRHFCAPLLTFLLSAMQILARVKLDSWDPATSALRLLEGVLFLCVVRLSRDACLELCVGVQQLLRDRFFQRHAVFRLESALISLSHIGLRNLMAPITVPPAFNTMEIEAHLISICSELRPTPAAEARRNQVLAVFDAVIRRRFGVSGRAFGSAVNGFELRSSDLDISVLLPRNVCAELLGLPLSAISTPSAEQAASFQPEQPAPVGITNSEGDTGGEGCAGSVEPDNKGGDTGGSDGLALSKEDLFAAAVAAARAEVSARTTGTSEAFTTQQESSTAQQTAAVAAVVSAASATFAAPSVISTEQAAAPLGPRLLRSACAAAARELAKELAASGLKVVEVIDTARVPIVKCVHRFEADPGSDVAHEESQEFEVDISFCNEVAFFNSKLLRAYAEFDVRAVYLCLLVKLWAKRRKLNSPFDGTLSSYSYCLLVIHYLQRVGILPNLQMPRPEVLRLAETVAPDLLYGATVQAPGQRLLEAAAGGHNVWFLDPQELSSRMNRCRLEQDDRIRWLGAESPQTSLSALLYGFFRYFTVDFNLYAEVASIRLKDARTSKFDYFVNMASEILTTSSAEKEQVVSSCTPLMAPSAAPDLESDGLLPPLAMMQEEADASDDESAVIGSLQKALDEASNSLRSLPYIGTVRSYSLENGFGFIQCEATFELYGRDVFLHQQQVFVSKAQVADRVQFKVQLNDRSQPQARDVLRVTDEEAENIETSRKALQQRQSVLEQQLVEKKGALKKSPSGSSDIGPKFSEDELVSRLGLLSKEAALVGNELSTETTASTAAADPNMTNLLQDQMTEDERLEATLRSQLGQVMAASPGSMRPADEPSSRQQSDGRLVHQLNHQLQYLMKDRQCLCIDDPMERHRTLGTSFAGQDSFSMELRRSVSLLKRAFSPAVLDELFREKEWSRDPKQRANKETAIARELSPLPFTPIRLQETSTGPASTSLSLYVQVQQPLRKEFVGKVIGTSGSVIKEVKERRRLEDIRVLRTPDQHVPDTLQIKGEVTHVLNALEDVASMCRETTKRPHRELTRRAESPPTSMITSNQNIRHPSSPDHTAQTRLLVSPSPSFPSNVPPSPGAQQVLLSTGLSWPTTPTQVQSAGFPGPPQAQSQQGFWASPGQLPPPIDSGAAPPLPKFSTATSAQNPHPLAPASERQVPPAIMPLAQPPLAGPWRPSPCPIQTELDAQIDPTSPHGSIVGPQYSHAQGSLPLGLAHLVPEHVRANPVPFLNSMLLSEQNHGQPHPAPGPVVLQPPDYPTFPLVGPADPATAPSHNMFTPKPKVTTCAEFESRHLANTAHQNNVSLHWPDLRNNESIHQPAPTQDIISGLFAAPTSGLAASRWARTARIPTREEVVNHDQLESFSAVEKGNVLMNLLKGSPAPPAGAPPMQQQLPPGPPQGPPPENVRAARLPPPPPPPPPVHSQPHFEHNSHRQSFPIGSIEAAMRPQISKGNKIPANQRKTL